MNINDKINETGLFLHRRFPEYERSLVDHYVHIVVLTYLAMLTKAVLLEDSDCLYESILYDIERGLKKHQHMLNSPVTNDDN